MRGELAHFTGISDPYEPPLAPEVVVDTHLDTVQQSVDRILARLERLGYLAVVEEVAA
jgi:adenylylsulfate kinase-like enzyme